MVGYKAFFSEGKNFPISPGRRGKGCLLAVGHKRRIRVRVCLQTPAPRKGLPLDAPRRNTFSNFSLKGVLSEKYTIGGHWGQFFRVFRTKNSDEFYFLDGQNRIRL